MEKLLKVFGLPPQISPSAAANAGRLKDQLQLLLDNYDTSFEPLIRSVQLLLVYNFDTASLFTNISPDVIVEGKVRLWTYAGERMESNKMRVFYVKLQPPLRKYDDCADPLLKSLDVIVLYNQDYGSLNLERSFATPSGDASAEGADSTGGAASAATMNFMPMSPRYSLEKVILNKPLREEILAALLILEKRKLIYEDWGFNEVEPAPKAILNFFGPSGTGKTMTAHAIAAHLGAKILAMNYADIESKYVGDAPKNLVKAFDAAQKENAVLFFDEADSFLGKRITNVSSSSDQAVNSLRSQMLILLENFTGLVIFATNLVGNYDKAFESRIFKHLHFGLPDKDNRRQIIKVTIPPRMVYEHGVTFSDEEIGELVELSDRFSGRHLKNAVLNSMIMAVSDGDRVCVRFEDFRNGFRSTKNSMDEFELASGGSDSTSDGGAKISAELQQTIEEAIQAKTENRPEPLLSQSAS